MINTLLSPAGAKTHEQLLSLLTRKRSGLYNKIYLYFPFRSNGEMADAEGINVGMSALPLLLSPPFLRKIRAESVKRLNTNSSR